MPTSGYFNPILLLWFHPWVCPFFSLGIFDQGSSVLIYPNAAENIFHPALAVDEVSVPLPPQTRECLRADTGRRIENLKGQRCSLRYLPGSRSSAENSDHVKAERSGSPFARKPHKISRRAPSRLNNMEPRPDRTRVGRKGGGGGRVVLLRLCGGQPLGAKLKYSAWCEPQSSAGRCGVRGFLLLILVLIGFLGGGGLWKKNEGGWGARDCEGSGLCVEINRGTARVRLERRAWECSSYSE
ncbi:hypothetical protein AXG93_789s1040 [Marchantia polymorpha subsp. ruderalis]|uniref:Uncharacterized protein n=1 Tax=Marchantia polymorpha subsp. ruderalis TaxID=1480154 RepID=A0A176VID9_MARPO|nr:hypothetical protein AXG93_789s1040 [Marchantia polymorpha subsp. ruderalis]